MKIQNLIFPAEGVCTEEEMFFRPVRDNVCFRAEDHALTFSEQGHVSFDTYFNACSVSKWKQYTTARNFRLNLMLQGSFSVILTNILRENEETRKNILSIHTVRGTQGEEFSFSYPETEGLVAFELIAQSDGASVLGGWYSAEVDEDRLWETNIAVNICTFRREPFVTHNLEILRKYIIDNPDSALQGHLRVYISDNGRTLPRDELCSEDVRIVPNKNAGGAAGFARGLLEIMEHSDSFAATHALMMDDDIVIEPEALFRTYTLLRCRKEEYADLFVGGAMLRLDQQTVQVESGASWNAGSLISNKRNLSMDRISHCLFNEEEEYVEYNAWWYCCTPMSVVSESNLPLPIFFRGDDLEYGLRNMKHLALMNGICVWHEPFENKYASFTQYYILRNLLYDNALHCPDFGLPQFLLRVCKSAARELVYYRYDNIGLLLRAVYDFYRGVDFLKETDGELLHREIMAAGYKAVPVEQLTGVTFDAEQYENSLVETESRGRCRLRFATLNGHLLPAKRGCAAVSMSQCRPINFYRRKTIIHYDAANGKAFVTRKSYFRLFLALLRLLWLTIVSVWKYPKAVKEFRDRKDEITNAAFWKRYLGLPVETTR